MCKGYGIGKDETGFYMIGKCKLCNGTGFFDSTREEEYESNEENKGCSKKQWYQLSASPFNIYITISPF